MYIYAIDMHKPFSESGIIYGGWLIKQSLKKSADKGYRRTHNIIRHNTREFATETDYYIETTSVHNNFKRI